jgi:hypothetical protein
MTAPNPQVPEKIADDAAAYIHELEQELVRAGGDITKAIQRIERRRADALIAKAIERSQSGETNWEALGDGLSRADMPSLLVLVWVILPPDQRMIAIGDAWTSPENPERAHGRSEWLPMFRAVGYLDDKPATPPRRITLWRGGHRRTRMAWTADRDRAVWLQHRHSNIGKGKLWTVTGGAREAARALSRVAPFGG